MGNHYNGWFVKMKSHFGLGQKRPGDVYHVRAEAWTFTNDENENDNASTTSQYS